MRLIDADAIQYRMLYRENWMAGTGTEAQGVWKSDIDEMPTVEERKTGKWRAFKIGECDLIECTACKVARPREEMPTRNGGKIAWKYCPECGAKMEGTHEAYRR